MAIDPNNRREFDRLSLQQMKDRERASLWGEDKLRQAREYIDEKEHGPERSRHRQMFWLGAVALVLSAVAIYTQRK
jgi:hypothetical protein